MAYVTNAGDSCHLATARFDGTGVRQIGSGCVR
jgi:hypothetical protein